MNDLFEFQDNYDLGSLPSNGTYLESEVSTLQKNNSENHIYGFTLNEVGDLDIFFSNNDYYEGFSIANLYLYRDINDNNELDISDPLLNPHEDYSVDYNSIFMSLDEALEGNYFVRVEYNHDENGDIENDEIIEYQLDLVSNRFLFLSEILDFGSVSINQPPVINNFFLEDNEVENNFHRFEISETSNLNITLNTVDIDIDNYYSPSLSLYRDENDNNELDARDVRISLSSRRDSNSFGSQEVSEGTYFARVNNHFFEEDNSRIEYELKISTNSFFAFSNTVDFDSILLDGTPTTDNSTLDANNNNLYKFKIDENSNIKLTLNIAEDDNANLYLYQDDNNNNILDPNDIFLSSSAVTNSNIIELEEALGTYLAVVEYDRQDGDNLLNYEIETVANLIPTKNENCVVYRFHNPFVGTHIYITDLDTKEFIESALLDYQLEGASYVIPPDPTSENVHQVYRMFNSVTVSHLYTTDENERDYILDNLPDFELERSEFYAYETQVEDSIPIYRFYEPNLGVHFYTSSEFEKQSVETNLSNYEYEGIAYYALPTEEDII